MSRGALEVKSKAFALEAIRLVHIVQTNKREYVLTKQYLRAATNPGAMAREAQHAESLPDFIHKLKIAKKEVEEAGYWYELLLESDRYLVGIDGTRARALQEEVSRLLTSIIRTSKLRLADQQKRSPKKRQPPKS